MSRRALLTIATAACLWGLYWSYARVVSPLIEPPHVERRLQNPISFATLESETGRNRRLAEQFLPDVAWAADAPWQLRTKNAALYTEDWQEVEADNSVRFTPFAMIWFQEDREPGEPPITLLADSAVVQFASKFHISDPDPGRVVGGKLEGVVKIAGPDGLAATGRNFIFSESALRIWSDHEVDFAYGPHSGHADRGMQVELIPVDSAPDDTELAVSGVRKIHLRSHVTMDVVLDEDDEPVAVHVECDGGFEYGIQSQIATFEENVRVRRPTGPAQADSLRCSLMTLVFEETSDSDEHDVAKSRRDVRGEGLEVSVASQQQARPDSARAAKTDRVGQKRGRFRQAASRLEFRRLLAEGPQVVLQSQDNDLTAQMSEFVYDDKSRTAVLRGGEAISEAVTVWQENSELHCPQITITHGNEGTIDHAWCQGAGWLIHRDSETSRVKVAAQWLNQLRKYPDAESGLSVFELQEQAIIRRPDQRTGITAELIKLWVDEDASGQSGGPAVVDVETEKVGDRSPTDENRHDDDDRFRPKQMLAIDNVAMVSPEFQGQANRLEVWFEKPDGTGTGSGPADGALLPPGLEPVDRRVNFGVNGSAGGDRPEASSEEAGTPDDDSQQPRKKEQEPVVVSSDLIRVRVLQEDEGLDAHIAEVWTSGDVHVQQERSNKLFELTGDRLHVLNYRDSGQVLHVHGEPALIRDGESEIEGQEVVLDRPRNLAWINGEGQLRLPVNNDLDGQSLAQPSTLTVWWKKKMTFDGDMADFFGDVRAVMKNSRMRCERMQVTLTQPVSFSDEQPSQDDAEIDNVICREHVEFDSYEYKDGKLTGIRRGRFGSFALNQVTGRMDAAGPGSVVFWRRGRKRAALSPLSVAQANRPLQSESVEWEFTHVDFAGTTTGNLKQRHTTFHDRVEIVYGPVARPQGTVSADDLPKDAGAMQCDSLRIMQQPETDEQPAYIELFAQGNARLEGRTFHARADEIVYDESKGMYMLRSAGNRKASIWRQKKPGEDYSDAHAQRMEFTPSRNRLKADQATGLQGLQ